VRLGELIGADLLNLGKVQGLGAPIASIGDAGTFDGVEPPHSREPRSLPASSAVGLGIGTVGLRGIRPLPP
jgi:hypothetical protein